MHWKPPTWRSQNTLKLHISWRNFFSGVWNIGDILCHKVKVGASVSVRNAVSRRNAHVDSNSQGAKVLVLLAGSSQLNGRRRLTCNSSSSPVTHCIRSNRMKANPETLKRNLTRLIDAWHRIYAPSLKKIGKGALPYARQLEPRTRKRSLTRPKR